MFPTVRKDTLYFASDGHPGYGGLDIFKAFIDSTGNWTVENLGKPINSSADDFGIIFENDNERGYFTSRRKGGRGGDDIYSVSLNIPVIEYFVAGVVRDAKTNAKLAEAELKLTGDDGSSLKRITAKDGAYKFRLAGNTEYLITVTREGYFAQKSNKISTVGLQENKTMVENLAMTSYEKPVEIPNIFFQFGKADLSKESTAALDRLTDIMNDNPNIMVELLAHTDNRGSDQANMTLSQRRAQTVVDYLILKGVDQERMKAKGLGESYPRTVTRDIAAAHPFLKTGQTLDEKFIDSLSDDQQKEECHALNRRTEIRVVSDKYEGRID
jgi:peptidoglycan-associated lipoprotein